MTPRTQERLGRERLSVWRCPECGDVDRNSFQHQTARFCSGYEHRHLSHEMERIPVVPVADLRVVVEAGQELVKRIRRGDGNAWYSKTLVDAADSLDAALQHLHDLGVGNG